MKPIKPINFKFGIRADGRVMKAGYLTAEHAEMFARGLFGNGCATVEVIDLVTLRSVKQVSSEAVAPL
jgi:hypothetical protein